MSKTGSNLREIRREQKQNGIEVPKGPKRPKRKLTEDEKQNRALANAIGDRLSLTLMQEIEHRAEETREATRRIRAELASAKPSMKKIAQLSRLRMTNMDLAKFNDSVQDRFGAMKKSHLDLGGKVFAPMQVVFVEQEAKPE